jgi:hypothetical protein
MPAQTLPPVPLDLVTFRPTLVQLPGGNAGRLGEVVVANESPVPLSVQIGQETHSLGAWVADKYQMDGATMIVTLTPQNPTVAMGATQQPPAPTAAALVTFNLVGDPPIPGIYPTALSRQQTSVLQQILVKQITVLNGADSGNVQFNVPQGTQAIVWQNSFATAFNGPASYGLNGASTRNPYFFASTTSPGFGSGQGIYCVPVVSADEPGGFTMDVSNAGGTGTVTIDIFAYLSQPVVWVRQNPTESFRTTQNGAQPAPWQSPDDGGASAATPIMIEVQLAASATAGIVAGNAGVQMRMFNLAYAITAAVAADSLHWKTTGNLPFFSDTMQFTGWRTYDHHGGPLGAVGDGINLQNLNALVSPFLQGVLGMSLTT